MKVVHLSTSVMDSSACIRLHNAMLARGIDSKVITLKSMSSAENIKTIKTTYLNKIVRKIDQAVLLIMQKRKEYPFSSGFAGVDLSGDPDVREADIIHLHWICGFVSYRGIKNLKQNGKKIVWTYHDVWPITGGCHIETDMCHDYICCSDCPFSKCGIYTRIQKNQKRRLLRETGLSIIAPSQWMKSMYERYMDQGNNCVVIPNIVDFDVFYKRKLQKSITDNCDGVGVEQNIKVLICVGSLDNPYKGYNYALGILGRLRQEHLEIAEKVFLHIVGEKHSEQKEISSYKHKYWGYIESEDKLASIYSASDILLYPSVADNLPNTIVEASACGVTTVAFEVGGVPELIDHMKTGYVARYKDSNDLYNGLLWALEFAKDKRLGDNARAKAKRMLDNDEIVSKHIKIYQSVLE